MCVSQVGFLHHHKSRGGIRTRGHPNQKLDVQALEPEEHAQLTEAIVITPNHVGGHCYINPPPPCPHDSQT